MSLVRRTIVSQSIEKYENSDKIRESKRKSREPFIF